MNNVTKASEATPLMATEKLISLRVMRVCRCGNDVRLSFEQADIRPGDVATRFTKEGGGVELQARAFVKPTGNNTFEAILSASDFEGARRFLNEQWDLYEDFEDDHGDHEDED